jgi:hypothetical protein
MTDSNTRQTQTVPAAENVAPVKIDVEDFDSLRSIQTFVDALAKYRQEMGRLVQLQGNMREEANRVEIELSEARTALAQKYNLEQMGSGQWALDFERREFVKTAPGTPVIP